MYRAWILTLLVLLLAPASQAQVQSRSTEILTRHHDRLTKLLGPNHARGELRRAEVLTERNGFVPSDEWFNNQRTTHTYSGHLRTISTDFSAEPGQEMVPASRSERTYDAQGRLTEMRFDFYVDDEFAPVYRSLSEYPANGSLPLVTTWQYYDNGWVNEEREVFTLAEDGSIFTSIRFEEWTGSAWYPDSRYSLTEIEAGLEYLGERWNGSDWVNWERVFAPGMTIAGLIAMLTEIGIIEQDLSGLMLPLGLLPDALYEAWDWDNGEWTPEFRQTSESVYEGETLTHRLMVMEYYEFNQWIPDMRIVLNYTDGGSSPNLFEMQFPNFEEEWETFMVELYAYSNTARIIAAEQYLIFDDETRGGEGPTMIPVGMYTFTWQIPTVSTEPTSSPGAIALRSVYPNPVSGNGLVVFDLELAGTVTLSVYDVLGRRVAILVDESLPAGPHEARLDVTTLSAGHYFVTLQAGSARQTRPITVVR